MPDRTCSIDDCDTPAATNSAAWCPKHYMRWYRHGDPMHVTVRRASTTCAVDGCEKGGQMARGWCSMHYARWRKYGDPLRDVQFRGDDEARFWSKVDKTSGCWLWTGAVTGSGYGSGSAGGKAVLAHRWAYELMVGPIPEGLEIDHLCRVTLCVNPAHLEPVTHDENVRRAMVTHCPAGHPYDEENTYVRPDRGSRECRVCLREQRRSRRVKATPV